MGFLSVLFAFSNEFLLNTDGLLIKYWERALLNKLGFGGADGACQENKKHDSKWLLFSYPSSYSYLFPCYFSKTVIHFLQFGITLINLLPTDFPGLTKMTQTLTIY